MFFKSKFAYMIPTHSNHFVEPAFYIFQNSCIRMNRGLNYAQKLKYTNCNINYNKRPKLSLSLCCWRSYKTCVPTSKLALHNFSDNFNANISLYVKKFIHSTTQCKNIFDRTVPRSPEEVQEILSQTPVSNPNSKLLKIAIIGVPNSGKSTLINQLLGWRVCSVSSKVHTTQCSARAVSNHDETQLIYLDTPGIVTPEEIKKYNLKQPLVVDPEKALEQADLIAVLHDVSNSYTHRRLNPRVLRLLLLFSKIPSVLILNKVDLIRKKHVLLDISNNLTDGIVDQTRPQLLSEKDDSEEKMRESLLNLNEPEEDVNKETTPHDPPYDEEEDEYRKSELDESRDAYDQLDDVAKSSIDDYENEVPEESLSFEDIVSGRMKPTEKQVQKVLEKRKGWPLFHQVFMTSGFDGTGVEDLKAYFLRSAKKAPWIFSEDVVTDQSPQEIVLMAVREKCLENFAHNVPYELKFKILNWTMSESDVLSVVVGIYPRRKHHLSVLIGKGGINVKNTSHAAEQELRNTFRTEVRLRIVLDHNQHVKSEI